MKRLAWLLALLCALEASAQVTRNVRQLEQRPSGPCTSEGTSVEDDVGLPWICHSGQWIQGPRARGKIRDSYTSPRSSVFFSGADHFTFQVEPELITAWYPGWDAGTLLLAVERDLESATGTFYLHEFSPMTSRTQDSIRLFVSGDVLTFEILDSAGASHKITRNISGWDVRDQWHKIHATWNSLAQLSNSGRRLELWIDGSSAGNTYTNVTANFTLTVPASWNATWDDFFTGNNRDKTQPAQSAIDLVLYGGIPMTDSTVGTSYFSSPVTISTNPSAWARAEDSRWPVFAGPSIGSAALTSLYFDASNRSSEFASDTSSTWTTASNATQAAATDEVLVGANSLKVVTTSGAGHIRIAINTAANTSYSFVAMTRQDAAADPNTRFCFDCTVLAPGSCPVDGAVFCTDFSGSLLDRWNITEAVFTSVDVNMSAEGGTYRWEHQANGNSWLDFYNSNLVVSTLKDGDFERFVSGVATNWTLGQATAAQDSAVFLGGFSSQQLTRSGTDAFVYQDITIGANNRFVLAGNMRSDGTATAKVEFVDQTAGGVVVSQASVTSTTWTRFELRSNFVTASTTYRVKLYAAAANGTANFDNVYTRSHQIETATPIKQIEGANAFAGDADAVGEGTDATVSIGTPGAPWRSVITRSPYVLTVGSTPKSANFDRVQDAWNAIPAATTEQWTIELGEGLHDCAYALNLAHPTDFCAGGNGTTQLASKDHVRITGRGRETTTLLNGINFYDVTDLRIANLQLGRKDFPSPLVFGQFGYPGNPDSGRMINVACAAGCSTCDISACPTSCASGTCSDEIYVDNVTCYTTDICFRIEGHNDPASQFVHAYVTNNVCIGNECINFEKGHIVGFSEGNMMRIGYPPARTGASCSYKNVGVEVGSLESDADTFVYSSNDTIDLLAACTTSQHYAAGIEFFKVSGDNMQFPRYSKITGLTVYGETTTASSADLVGIRTHDGDATTQQNADVDIIDPLIHLVSKSGSSSKLFGIHNIFNSPTAPGIVKFNISGGTVTTTGTGSGAKLDLSVANGVDNNKGLAYLSNVFRSDRTPITHDGTWGTNLFGLDTNFGRFGDRLGIPLCKTDPPTGGTSEEICIDDTNNKLCVKIGSTWRCVTVT